MIAYLLITFALYGQPQPCAPQLMARIAHVESRGSVWATSPVGCVGLHQVQPKYSYAPRWALRIPVVSRWEGCRILRRWQHRCKGSLRCALRAYSHGNAGLRGEGEWYANKILGGSNDHPTYGRHQ
jgi:hypothetical protein